MNELYELYELYDNHEYSWNYVTDDRKFWGCVKPRWMNHSLSRWTKRRSRRGAGGKEEEQETNVRKFSVGEWACLILQSGK